MPSDSTLLSSSATAPRRKFERSPNVLMLGRWVFGSRCSRELGTLETDMDAPVSGGAAHREAVDAQCRLPDADRHALAFLAARAHSGVECHVVADHRHARQRIRPVADDGRAL